MRLTEAFDGIRAIIESNLALQRQPMQPVPDSIRSIADSTERVEALHAWLHENPSLLRHAELYEQLRALNLVIVDETGARLDAWLVSIAPFPPGPFEPWMRPDFERAGFEGDPPFFMACAAMAPPDALRAVLGG